MNHTIKSCLLVLTVIFGLGFAFYGFLTAVSADPEIAVRKYVFLQRHPLEAVNIKIARTGMYDERYGHYYFVEGYYDKGKEIKFFYLKQSSTGWIVSTSVKGR